ncbi:hypothetical protein ANO11243_017960 [Dothideomycetidae sp. 11243]|nr:hypothetical protein ANO11243_017960 [fungal sp. No.11243]
MAGAKYTLLSQEGVVHPEKTKRSPALYAVVGLALFLALSVSLNAALLYRLNIKPWELGAILPSEYASLQRDSVKTFYSHPRHASPRPSVQNPAWAEADLDSFQGIVALDDQYVAAKGLLKSKPWPWDPKKSVYFLSGPHQMHCVNAIREYINNGIEGFPKMDPVYSYPHIMHCVNVLREGVMCAADDTPQYMGKYNANTNAHYPIVGEGQNATCRNWGALMNWARNHSACYLSKFDPNAKNMTELERYKFCPDGSQPWLEVEKRNGTVG